LSYALKKLKKLKIKKFLKKLIALIFFFFFKKTKQKESHPFGRSGGGSATPVAHMGSSATPNDKRLRKMK
jgi:hypothetical protein